MLVRRMRLRSTVETVLSDEELQTRAEAIYTEHKVLSGKLVELSVEMAHAVGGVMLATEAMRCYDSQFSEEHSEYKRVQREIDCTKSNYEENIRVGKNFSRQFGYRCIELAKIKVL